MASLNQIAANRRNARLSTGPKTAAGKANSRLNAMKHGLLSRQPVVQGYKFKESAREFKKSCRKYHQHYSPVGPVEESLVDEIVLCRWRLRRVVIAEAGEIARSVDEGWWSRQQVDPLRDTMLRPVETNSEGLVTALEGSSRGIAFLVLCLHQLYQDVAREGELTEDSLAYFNHCLRGESHVIGLQLAELRAQLTTNPEKLPRDVLRHQHREHVQDYLIDQIRELLVLRAERKERENKLEAAQQAAAVMPSAGALEKIRRYETHLKRELYRATQELERLQRRRRGKQSPAPRVMEISAKN